MPIRTLGDAYLRGDVGARLRAARLEAGLGQRALQLAGATYAYISRIESNQRVPSLSVLIALADRIGGHVTGLYLATGQYHDCPLCRRDTTPRAAAPIDGQLELLGGGDGRGERDQ